HEEVEEPGQRPGLVLHGQPRPSALPLVGEEAVGVGGLCRPDRSGQELDELEQHRPVGTDALVADAGTDRGEQVLVDELLLVVLDLLRRPHLPVGLERPHYRERHRVLQFWGSDRMSVTLCFYQESRENVNSLRCSRTRLPARDRLLAGTVDPIKLKGLPTTDPAALARAAETEEVES